MENAQKMIDDLKEKIEDEEKNQEEELKKVSEEMVEEDVQEDEEEAEEITEEIEEPEKGVEDDEEEEKAPSKDNKAWAKMRHEIKERDSVIDDMRQQMQQMQVQMAEQKGFQEALKQPETVDSDPEPDPTLDPEEHTAWLLRKKDKEINELRSTQEQHSTLIKEQQDRVAVQNLEDDYKRRNPEIDYDAAKEFIKERERTILKLQYPDANDAQINAHFDTYEMNLFRELAAKGINATDVIVKMANEYGYDPKTTDEPSKKKPNFKALKKNQEKNASLIGGSDAVAEAGVTPEQLFNMSIDQLASNPSLFKKAHKNIERSR